MAGRPRLGRRRGDARESAGPSLEAIIDAPVLGRFVAAGAAVALLSTAAHHEAPQHRSTDPDTVAAVAARAGTDRPATRAGQRSSHRAGPRLFGPALTVRVASGIPAGQPIARKPVRRAVVRAERHRVEQYRAERRVAQRSRPHARGPARRPAVRAYARPAGASRAGAVVLSYAQAQIGRPYIKGGAGRRGFDCSGLTMRAYQQVGVRLAHKAARQRGRPVSRAAARPGDLVKWGSYHVGVYAGAGWVIHAPKPGDRVKRSRLWGRYRIVRVR